MLQVHRNGKENIIGGSILDASQTEVEQMNPEYITYYDHLEDYPSRILGQYKFGTATAELTRVYQGKSGYTRFLRLKFVKLADGQEIYTLIRAGKILPRISYEEKQIDTPVQQLRDLARLLFRQLVTTTVTQFRSWAADIRSRMAA